MNLRVSRNFQARGRPLLLRYCPFGNIRLNPAMAVRQMGNSTEKLVEAGFLLGFLAWGGNIFGWVGAEFNMGGGARPFFRWDGRGHLI